MVASLLSLFTISRPATSKEFETCVKTPVGGVAAASSRKTRTVLLLPLSLILTLLFLVLMLSITRAGYLLRIILLLGGFAVLYVLGLTWGERPLIMVLLLWFGILPYFLALLGNITLGLIIGLNSTLMLIIAVPITEEIWKVLLSRVRAGWSAGLAVGAGFGFFEGITFLVFYSWVPGLIYIRAVGLMIHALCSAVAFEGVARGQRWRWLLLAVGIHSLYNLGYPLVYEHLSSI